MIDVEPRCPTRCGAMSPPGHVFCAWCWKLVAPRAQQILAAAREHWRRGQASDEEYDEALQAALVSFWHGKRHPGQRGVPSRVKYQTRWVDGARVRTAVVPGRR